MARLTSAIYEPSNKPECVEFWYHMYGANIGQLNVYKMVNGQRYSMLTKKGNQADMWIQGSFTVNETLPWQVRGWMILSPLWVFRLGKGKGVKATVAPLLPLPSGLGSILNQIS